MRLPASRVYRAFVELDRFSDEQCERFLAAATRGIWLNLASFFFQLVCALAVSCLCVWLVLLAAELRLVTTVANRLGNLSILAALVAILGPAGLAWLVIKDRLLRRRIRRVINTRGSCGNCGYVLTGLPVGPDLGVVCPECGFRLAVEATLGEVVEVEDGVRRFMPSPDVVPPLLNWLTPERKRRLVRLSFGVSAAVVLLLLLSWGGYEWFLWRQAKAAQASRVGVEGLIEFVEKHQAKDADASGPDAWEAFYDAQNAISQHDNQTWLAGWGQNGSAPVPDFSQIYAPAGSDADEDTARRTGLSGDLARRLIDEYRAAGVYAKFEKMTACRRTVRPINPPAPNRPLMDILLPELGQARNMARINGARMKLALDSGDQAEFVSALEANLALVRMCRHGPVLIDRAVGAAIQSLTFERIRRALTVRRDRAWIDAVQGAIDRQRDDVPYEVALEGEKLFVLDTVAWCFEEPSRVRGGRFARPLLRLSVGWSSVQEESKSVGTFARNHDLVASVFAAAIDQVRLEPWQRPPTSGGSSTGLLLVDILAPSLRSNRSTADLERLQERGLAVLLALERFRCENGAYPKSLSELMPRHLGALPPDPWSGRPLVYRRLGMREGGEPAYLLYSVGADGIDNGGTPAEEGTDALDESGAGFDYLVNPPPGNGAAGR